MPDTIPDHADVVVVGAGHNGLVAATLLARAGLEVVVLERDTVLGGAARTEHPYATVPGLAQSTGSYLLGLMPPELLELLDLDLTILRRDPHYFLPTLTDRYLLLGSDKAASRAAYESMFTPADRDADDALAAEIGKLRDDLAPAWLQEPLSVEATAERWIRPELQQTFIDLVTGSVADYLDRFEFATELLPAMYAVTDGLSGLHAGPDTKGSGHNFLVHNMCRLPGADGTWMIVKGGMGAVADAIAAQARTAGATLFTDKPVATIEKTGNAITGVMLADGTAISTSTVVAGCDPFTLSSLIDLPTDLQQRLRDVRLPGTTMKVNLAFRDLPTFSCLPAGAPSPFGSTIHLLAQDEPMTALREMWADVEAGRLPERPTIEWYLHTTVDESLRDADGHHSSALFVQSVPFDIEGSSWEAEKSKYVDKLLAICDEFAPGSSDLVADAFPLAPPDIERHFGIKHGHIHHIDNGFAFDQRMPYATGIDGLYACSAGCHPAGSVIGAAGHNAARKILADLGQPS